MYNGIINIYKEKGFTSHDVVAKMRGILKQKKIGHTGTLDPDAVGVLPVCLGSGTKLCDILTDHDKEYEAVMQLGITTDTQDTSGSVLTEHKVEVTKEQVTEAIMSFVGDYAQVPPMYSALKVNGKKLYELARAGKEVERSARAVVIYQIEILSMDLPFVTMRVMCSKGTYIRTLNHDIGQKLGCGAAMASLKRTRVGMFSADQAITLSELEDLEKKGRVSEKMIPVDQMFPKLSSVHVQPEFYKLIDNGNAFYPDQILERRIFGDREEVLVYSADGRFYGVYRYTPEEGRFTPVKMFFCNYSEPGKFR